MKVTYYLEVISSWCHWVEPVWAELKVRYKGRAEFEWKIAAMRKEEVPESREQCDWYYRRSGGTVMNSPYMLNSGWFDERLGGSWATTWISSLRPERTWGFTTTPSGSRSPTPR